jgi:hypothetical protein
MSILITLPFFGGAVGEGGEEEEGRCRIQSTDHIDRRGI